ncbi:RNA polymerase sigma-70 factor [Lunatibacter salilacus]|uniref:RNA polymerase sigma-70 factor n=1 Tax=Lunatibacter salilacus TaxID=2483804 RepID=UPI00131CDEDA|nr:RNA polymerase sigma-70 factor [Lunatibacter salilacus]
MQDSDKNLLRLIALDDMKAFRTLYDKYWEVLIKHAYARLHDVSEAEDLVQDVFLDIWKNRKVLNIHHAVRNYLFTAVKYKVFRVLDHKYTVCELNPNGEFDGDTVNGSHILEFEELYHRIEVIVDSLPERQKVVFKLSRYNHLSTKEIAAELHLAPQTVHNRIHQSLVYLRAELKHFILMTAFIPIAWLILNL